MAPEQGPDSKPESSGKIPNTTTGSGSETNSNHHSSLGQAATLQTDSVGWIYLLRKDKLVEVCQHHGIATEGATVDHLRRILGELIRRKRQRASTENLLRALEEEVLEEERKPVSTIPNKAESIAIPNRITHNMPSDSEVMATIRRWDLTYDGNEQLMEFIERLEELAECYSFPQSKLLFALLEILKGRALQWYRVKRTEIRSWESFKQEAMRFFLPKRHLAHLEESIYHRKQGPREKAKDYMIDLQTLIRQHPELRKLDHTDRIYDGLRAEYRLYVRRSDFQTIDELMELTDEYELLRREESRQTRPQPSHYMGPTYANEESPYEPRSTCWRCKQRGHFRTECTNRRKLFCSRCGKDGVFSRECPCQPARDVIRTDGRYYLDVGVNGVRMRALVDTGSTLTYVGESIIQQLQQYRIRPRMQHRSVQLADGTCIDGINVYPISVLFNGRSTKLLASALPNLAEPLILGMDFLRRRQIGLMIDGIQVNMSFPQNSYQPPLYTVISRNILQSTKHTTEVPRIKSQRGPEHRYYNRKSSNHHFTKNEKDGVSRVELSSEQYEFPQPYNTISAVKTGQPCRRRSEELQRQFNSVEPRLHEADIITDVPRNLTINTEYFPLDCATNKNAYKTEYEDSPTIDARLFFQAHRHFFVFPK